MATEAAGWQRRHWLAGAAALVLAGRHTNAIASPATVVLVTAWDDADGRHLVGLLNIDADRSCTVLASLEVPTRAHGLVSLADGSVVAVARRPGDWLLHWKPGAVDAAGGTGKDTARWVWAGEDRRFNGHLLADAEGHSLFSSETDLASGSGLLVRRDLATLQETAAWPTRGDDPHDMEWLADGRLLVANGGIRSSAETGRAKLDLEKMDSSLVAIDPRNGALSGQWRLADRWLGMRHLARQRSGLIGVALQAEHVDAAQRAHAPLLAIFDPQRGELTSVASHQEGSAYAGDIAALPDGWAVSCPRDHELLQVPAAGGPPRRQRLTSVCALATALAGDGTWALGASALSTLQSGDAAILLPSGHRFDNHAVAWAGTGVSAA